MSAPNETSPHETMLRMITGYWVTQMIRGAAVIALADHLAQGPMTPQEIARAANIHEGATSRFLRGCVTVGLVTPAPDGRFATTPLLDTLRTDAPGSMRGMAMAQGAPGHWLSWGRFPDVLATGRYQTVEALGSDLFDYYADHPHEAADFSRAMTGMTAMVASDLVGQLDVEGVTRAVDVGGAEGALVRSLMTAHPAMTGVVFDRPGVAGDARRAMDAAGFGDRLDIVAGDFFAEVPAGDLYLLKTILHDWDDDSCRAILRNCRRAAMPGARVAIVEFVLGDVDAPGFAPLLDLNMLALCPGKERTFAEYRILLEASGFRDARIVAMPSGMSLIEADAA